MTETPETYFREWQIVALVAVTIVTILISSSPRTAFYSIVVAAGLFLLANGVLAFVSGLRRDIDQ